MTTSVYPNYKYIVRVHSGISKIAMAELKATLNDWVESDELFTYVNADTVEIVPIEVSKLVQVDE